MQTLKMAWNAVISNKLRTFLTMLGIMIGVTALVVLVSIGNGASNTVSDQISDMGTDYMSVQISDDKDQPIRISEFMTLFDDDSIGDAAPIARTSATGSTSYTEDSITLYGTTGGYFNIMGDEIAYGRNLKISDIENHTYVIVLTYDTAVEYFGHANAVGETISLDGNSYEVVGVLAEDSTTPGSSMTVNSSTTTTTTSDSSESDSSDSESETVTLEGFIPFSTMTRMAENVLDITQFYVSAADSENMDAAEQAVTNILMARLDNDSDAFTITTQSEIMETQQEVSNTLSLMLGGIAAISLLVGGIGIMNIMLVSVTERTREIGIRKAIGATQGSIMGQFLLEALIISLAGCGFGILMSFVILRIVQHFMTGMTLTVDMNVALIAVIFSAVIGVLFGSYPAHKAAVKKPIDALRFSE
ncbi:MAG: ABC transporter permease [Eubacteriales bacterium]|jgi:putative ABC transport system permease protein